MASQAPPNAGSEPGTALSLNALRQCEHVLKSDISDLGFNGGVPEVNALGERRGLLAFKIIAVGSDPDGGGSQLPNLVIEVVDPIEVDISGTGYWQNELGGGGVRLVG